MDRAGKLHPRAPVRLGDIVGERGEPLDSRSFGAPLAQRSMKLHSTPERLGSAFVGVDLLSVARHCVERLPLQRAVATTAVNALFKRGGCETLGIATGHCRGALGVRQGLIERANLEGRFRRIEIPTGSALG